MDAFINIGKPNYIYITMIHLKKIISRYSLAWQTVFQVFGHECAKGFGKTIRMQLSVYTCEN